MVVRPYCALLTGTLQPAAQALTVLRELNLARKIKTLSIDVSVRRHWSDPGPLPVNEIDDVVSTLRLVEKRIALISKYRPSAGCDAMKLVRSALSGREIRQIAVYRRLKPQSSEANAKLDVLFDFAGTDAACEVASAAAWHALSVKAYSGLAESIRMLSASLVCLQRRCAADCPDRWFRTGSALAVRAVHRSWCRTLQCLNAEQTKVHDSAIADLESSRAALHEIAGLPEPEMKVVNDVLGSMTLVISRLRRTQPPELPAVATPESTVAPTRATEIH
jgi:hypothetical protein